MKEIGQQLTESNHKLRAYELKETNWITTSKHSESRLIALADEKYELIMNKNILSNQLVDLNILNKSIQSQLEVTQVGLLDEENRHENTKVLLSQNQANFSDLKSELALMKSNYDDLKLKCKGQDDDISRLKTEREKYREVIDLLETEKEKQSNRIELLEDEGTNQRQEISDLENTLEDVRNTLNTCETDLNERDLELEDLKIVYKEEKERLSAEIVLLTQQRDEEHQNAVAARDELSKHRQLISYINQLSAGAEGPAGVQKARRLSDALSQEVNVDEKIMDDTKVAHESEGRARKVRKNNT